jgi:hypothetical protein
MLVPPTATFADFGLGVDLAFGRWDVTRRRSFRAGWRGRHERRGSGKGDLPPERIVHGSMTRGTRFEYLFDDDEKWVHECVVEELIGQRETVGRPPIAVPILGWGTVPDQFGRLRPEDVTLSSPRAPGRRHRGTAKPLDLDAVRQAARENDVGTLLSAIEGRDLGMALQQVGDALMRAYRSAGAPEQGRLVGALREIETLLGHRGWDGDDVLADEIGALLGGSERRVRTLSVDIEDLSEVMANGGEDPGGYLHLDTGEVVHAFLHHGMEDLTTDQTHDEDDNLWIYVDHDASAAYADMAAFAATAPDRLGGILSVAIKGRGAIARFRRTVDELDLWNDWQVFSDDRAFGRARALLRSQGIRPV